MIDREEIRVPALGEPVSHYTDAVRLGDLLFVSGCCASDGHGNVVGVGDVTAQARQTLRNLGAILAAAGATFADVAKVNVYVKDIDDRQAIDVARRELFGDARPASTLVEVSRFVHPDFLLEIEAVARVPSGRRG